MNDNPWMKFYPGDWRSSLALQGCSLAARGLWIELLAIMRGAPREGFLADAEGTAIPLARIAGMVNASQEEVSKLLAELERAGVAKRLDGVFVSRRQVRYAQRSEDGRRAVEKRWNRPQDAPEAVPSRADLLAFQHRSDGSGSSVSSSGAVSSSPSERSEKKKASIRKVDPTTMELPAELDYPDVRAALVDYLASRKGGSWNETLAKVRVREMAVWGRTRAVAALKHSAGYQGLFEPPASRLAPPGAPGGQRVDAEGTRRYLDEIRSTPRGAPPKPMAELLAEAKKKAQGGAG